ncbi:molybdenum storage protein subunit alpha [Pseudonocardia sp. NPDC049635]|uniref:amino acid kinase family protein n=1 Tax=Pseudonocardia sp. NPDC049635 TaxID=3155506 RepID=UPI003404EFCD
MSGTYPKDVESALARQTLLDRDRVRPVDQRRPVVRMLPRLRVVVLGGRSVIDRGRDVLLPLVAEIRAALDGDPLLICTGAGVRARHVLGVGLDLGLPTGALAELAGREAEQNGHLVAALLADRGVAYLGHDTVAHQLPVHLAASNAVVTNGWPPFGVHEFPAGTGKLPPHRTDTGALLLADAWGAASLTYVRAGERSGPGGAVGAAELLGGAAAELPIDREALATLQRTKHVRSVQVIDGTASGNLTAALAGRHVGTVISG